MRADTDLNAEPSEPVPRARGMVESIAPLDDEEPADLIDPAASAHVLTSLFARVDEPPDDVEPPPAVGSTPDARPPAIEFFMLEPGVQVGPYVLEEKLGQGSFGVVYAARHRDLDREVALKILNPSHHGDHDALQRFLREARAAARIAHPGVVMVHDCGRVGLAGDEALAFIAMERLRGVSLAQRLEETGPLHADAAVDIARQVAAALDAAHRADVLHRDLKPDNIFLVPDPKLPVNERVKVLDFGLAKIGRAGHTELGSVFGTPIYMSPEQCRSSGEVDARADIYALGCILFELLTGQAPFEGLLYEVLERHQREIAPLASSLAPAVPPALDELIAHLLAKDPDDRPPTMSAVRQALDALAGEPPAPDSEGGGLDERRILARAFGSAAPWLRDRKRTPMPMLPVEAELPIDAEPAPESAAAPLYLDDDVEIAPIVPRARSQHRVIALIAAIAVFCALAGALIARHWSG